MTIVDRQIQELGKQIGDLGQNHQDQNALK
jgi:hypothetical protein